MDRLREVLLEIRDGKHVFEPPTRSQRDVVKFQETVEALLAAERKNLVGKIVKLEAAEKGRHTIVGNSCESGRYLRRFGIFALEFSPHRTKADKRRHNGHVY
jgi:hypothetical protein